MEHGDSLTFLEPFSFLQSAVQPILILNRKQRLRYRRRNAGSKWEIVQGQSGNGAKSKRQESSLQNLRRDLPRERQLLRGWFNNGWKGCSAQPPSQSKRTLPRASILSNPLVIRPVHRPSLSGEATVLQQNRSLGQKSAPYLPSIANSRADAVAYVQAPSGFRKRSA